MSLINDGVATSFRLGAWGETTGYPSVVTFHEERLVFAATPLQPQTFWMSVSGDYVNHSPTARDSAVLDDSAITGTLASGKVNAIKWMSSGPTLILGTYGSEWQLRPGSVNLNDAITPTNISVVRHTTHGSNNVRPLRVGPAVMFVQRSGKRIRELVYDYQTDSLQAKDVTIINEQILRRGGKVISMTYQQEPNSTLWCALADGTLAGLTYVRDQDVYAWHPHVIGGNFNGGNAVVEGVACIPGQDGDEDVLWMVVKRTINGVTKRYIEYMSAEIDPEDDTDKSRFTYVDCARRIIAGSPQLTFDGFFHLLGESLQVVADGAQRPDIAPTTYQITLESPATEVVAGLPCPSICQTLNPEGGNPTGSSQGKVKRIDHVCLRLYNSLGFKMGPSESKLKPYSFRKPNDQFDNSPNLRSEDVPVTFEDGYNKEGSVVIVQDKPYPLNILAVVIDIDTAV